MTLEELEKLASEWVDRSKGVTQEGWLAVLETVTMDRQHGFDTGPELVDIIKWLGNEARNTNTRAKYRRVWLVVKRELERKGVAA